ncbi:MAG: hypothetical protein LUI60_07585 [Clostridia bacterium]|nr:hypothetical protein [Clostridia bacterium]
MVIFHTDHWGAMAHYIVLAVTKHKDDEKVLIFTECTETKRIVMTKLQKEKIFDKVIFGNEIRRPGAKLKDKDLIRKEIVQTIDEVLLKNDIDICHVNKVYTATDIDGFFRYYLMQKKVYYTLVMLDAWDIYYSNVKNRELYTIGLASEQCMNLFTESHLFDGTNEYCKEIIAFPSTEIKDAKLKKKAVKYDLLAQLDEISKSTAKIILNCFDVNFDYLSKLKRILISNSDGAYRKQMEKGGIDAKNKEEHALLYQLLIDFYSYNNEEIIVKPHPHNFLNWGKYFDLKELSKDMPIEFIRFNKDCFINEVIGLQTTSIPKIQDKVQNVVLSTMDYATYYHSMCKLYVVSKLFIDCQIGMQFEQVGFTEGFLQIM